MSSIREKYGKASTQTGGGKFLYENFKLVEGKNIFRLFPPMKSLKDLATGWSYFHRVHYGYSVKDQVDPNKRKMRPFLCVEDTDRKTGMVTTSCPECRKIEAQEMLLEDRKKTETASLIARGITNSDEIEKHVKPLVANLEEWLKSHNRDSKMYFLAMNTEGKFGVLKIAYKHFKSLKAFVDEQARDNTDIFDFDNGVWINIKRVGKDKDTAISFSVDDELVQLPDGRRVKQPRLAPLTDEQLDAADKALPDLTTMFRQLSPAQIQLLVESNNDPDMVDSVFAMTQRSKERSNERSPAQPPVANLAPALAPLAPLPSQVVAPVVAPAPVAVPAPAPVVAAPPAVDQAAMIAQLQAQLAAMMANQAPATPAPVVAAPVTPAATKLDPLDPNMGADEFRKLFPDPRG